MLKIRFYIDPDTDLPHIYNHDIDESEVEDILTNPGEDRTGREDSRVAIELLCRKTVTNRNITYVASK